MTLENNFLLNNRYRIISILGQGGMGNVYRAKDLNLTIDVAVKENLYLSEEYTRQFKREAEILASLRHPNLPKVTDHFEIPNQGQYLVMEYINGEDLRDRMDRLGTLPDDEVVHIGVAICDALTYLHERKPPIYHRDVKPGNVRITEDGHVLLVDFGLAKVHSGKQETTSGARAMTPGYSPPEQYGSSRTDARSDIYALGATLYAALCGTPPEESLIRATDFTDLTPVRQLSPKTSPKLALVIEKALSIRAESRFQTANDMKLALLDVFGESVSSKPIVIAPPPYKKPSTGLPGISTPLINTASLKRKSKVWIPIVLVTLVSFILVIFAMWFFNPFANEQTTSTATETQIIVQITPPTSEPEKIIAKITDIPRPVIETETSNNQTEVNIPTEIKPTADFSPVPLNPNPGKIAFSSLRNGLPQIFVMSTNGEDQTQVTDYIDGACQPDWSPDGKKIVFVAPCTKKENRYPKGNLYIVELDSGFIESLDTGLGGNYDPSWSPDGKFIAFTKEINARTQVYVLDLESGSVVAVSDGKDQTRQPSWSDDGLYLVFIQKKYDDQIVVLNIFERTSKQVTRNNGLVNSRPLLTPDKSTIYYTQSSKDQYNPRIMGIQVDLSTEELFKEYRFPEQNYSVPLPATDQDISPDGYWLVFESWPDGTNHDIYISSVNGQIVHRLTTEPKFDFHPSWLPETAQ